ncbi:hypothetical protein C0J52_26626, partial [Blattella germanica]
SSCTQLRIYSHSSLSSQSFSCNPLSLIVLSIPSVQVIFGRPLFLLPISCHSKIFFGNLCSLILSTCPNHLNCAVNKYIYNIYNKIKYNKYNTLKYNLYNKI